MRTGLIAILLLTLLSACSRGDKIDIDCPPFASMTHKVPMTQLEREIHGLGARQGLQAQAVQDDQDLPRRLDAVLGAPDGLATSGTGRPSRAVRPVLMLSGGGQWGAYGAGFLAELRQRQPLPDPRLVTGISTGALQSIFVSIGNDAAYRQLLEAYAPAKESDVVDRGGFLRVLFKGSMAGLGPLQLSIERALCPDAIIDDPSKPCALDALRAMQGPGGRQTKAVLIGFTEAASGDFKYVDVVDLAQLPRRTARSCITGAALASAAMPVDFEQVQINGVTYYDGGTRASVFEAHIAESARRVTLAAEAAPMGDARRPGGAPPLLPIYVVRNGPTTALPAPDVNTDSSPLTAAMRAEAILVNQLEVTSIAVIRIAHPTGPLNMTSADGWDTQAKCVKPGGGVMFAPEFMACLTRYGRARAAAAQPWIALSELPLPPDR
jgi:predicted acylesterase/phospholipase RssA